MVFSTNRLFNEGFLHAFSIDRQRIAVLAERHFRRHLEAVQLEAEPVLHPLAQLVVYLRAAITRHLEPFGGGYMQMVEDGSNQAAVPQQGLWRQVVDAEGIPELDVRDSLV